MLSLRWLALILLIQPLAARADGQVPTAVDLNDVLVVSDLRNWQGSTFTQRVLLVLTEDKTAADLVTIVTDPVTGDLTGREKMAGILPAKSPRLESDLHTLALSREADGVQRLLLWISGPGMYGEVFLGRRSDGWDITRASLTNQDKNLTCRIESVDDGTFVERVISDQVEIESRTRDAIGPFWWQSGLAAACDR
ncbi:hypothetical protein [Yoonia sp. 2307UL14-13]|uniref:hypothetical protein n=1 Tax=Yoonia sp. 2307UL14-13 TaxID=3126506 RepID=UPI0030AC1933